MSQSALANRNRGFLSCPCHLKRESVQIGNGDFLFDFHHRLLRVEGQSPIDIRIIAACSLSASYHSLVHGVSLPCKQQNQLSLSPCCRNDGSTALRLGGRVESKHRPLSEMPVPDYAETLAFPMGVNINNQHVMRIHHETKVWKQMDLEAYVTMLHGEAARVTKCMRGWDFHRLVRGVSVVGSWGSKVQSAEVGQSKALSLLDSLMQWLQSASLLRGREPCRPSSHWPPGRISYLVSYNSADGKLLV